MAFELARRFVDCGLGEPPRERDILADVARRADVPEDAVTLQERHLAQAFQQAVFVEDEAETLSRLTAFLGTAPRCSPDDPVGAQLEIRSHLMKAGRAAYVEEKFLSFDEARSLVLELQGVPCYPVLADGTDPICGFEDEPHRLVDRLRERGIPSAEFIPNRNEASLLEEYVLELRNAGFAVTAGTEHNTNDKIAIEPVCKRGEPIPDRCREVFWEGACVQAGHQTLVLRGERGLTNSDGSRNQAMSLTSLAAIGREAIEAAAQGAAP